VKDAFTLIIDATKNPVREVARGGPPRAQLQVAVDSRGREGPVRVAASIDDFASSWIRLWI
jgi:hypothetical protein